MPLNGSSSFGSPPLFAYDDRLTPGQSFRFRKESRFFLYRFEIKGNDLCLRVLGEVTEDLIIFKVAFIPHTDDLADFQMMVPSQRAYRHSVGPALDNKGNFTPTVRHDHGNRGIEA